jgi:hypothetical protein
MLAVSSIIIRGRDRADFGQATFARLGYYKDSLYRWKGDTT